MASENFWKDSDWTEDPQFGANALKELLDHEPSEKPAIGRLLKQYYRSIFLNLFFLLLTLLMYVIRPIPDMLLPIGIISCCFLYMLYHVVIAARNINQTVDMSLDLKSTIKRTLEINKKATKRMTRVNSMIMTSSFIGGFLLGLLMSDWTIVKMTEKPVVLLIGGALAIGFYFLTKNHRFSGFQKMLNPSYFKAKEQLEAQLKALEEE